MIRLGRQHVRNDRITFTAHKGRNRKPKRLTLPILPVLQRSLDASPCGDMTFLINDLGRPFTDAGIGNRFRDWCDLAGLPHCTAHGTRKAGATIAAENGATAHMLMAMFGWDTLKQAEVYTRAADQRGGSTVACAQRHAHDRIRSRERIRLGCRSHFGVEWDLFRKSKMISNRFFGGGAQGRAGTTERNQRLKSRWDTEIFPRDY
jgi:Phage integrase family